MSEFRLPRLPKGVKLVNPDGSASDKFARWWQNFAEQIELEVGALEAATIAQAAAVTATAAAASATASAATAQTAADGANEVAALTASGVSGVTITATDAGANVTVTISAHTRLYGDGTSVAVNGGSVLALPYSTDEFIYYDDPTRGGGAVTYAATTSETTAAQTGDRHLVGMVTTPAAAAPPELGEYVRPPGIGGIIP